MADLLVQTAAFDLNSHTITCALFNNSVTPDNDATSANTAYNAGTWLTANEVTSSTQWPAGGRDLGSPTINSGTADTVYFTGNSVASLSGATITNAFGTLVYDNTLASPVANQGICFNYFGAGVSVSNGVLTIVWHSDGIFRMSL